jgi:hypothetical protein
MKCGTLAIYMAASDTTLAQPHLAAFLELLHREIETYANIGRERSLPRQFLACVDEVPLMFSSAGAKKWGRC